MNHKMVRRILGSVLLILAGLMLLPLIAGLCYHESVTNFIISILAAAAAGGALWLSGRTDNHAIFAREGYVSVGLAWVLMGLFGALPLVLSGDIPNYLDAVFETVSGLTTTGSTIVTDVESLTRGGLFWRSFTHWIGGMGILVFIMAVLPMGGDHAMHIMRAEVPGPTVGKLVPRLRNTAKILYLIYTGLTVIETGLLLLGGMSFYDALLHAFASAGTGGFSTRAASIAAFDSVYIEVVIGIFLILFSANFNLYYLILLGRARDALKNEELRCFLSIIALSVAAITLGIGDMYGGYGTGLRHAFFNVTSIMSTAGFCTVDFTLWPQYCQLIIVGLMFIGGCAGGTGGGLKLSRVMILVRSAFADLRQVLSPRTVRRVQMDGRRIEPALSRSMYAYFILYTLILMLCTFVVSLDGYDHVTSFTALLTCLSNVGPGLSLVGPMGNFSIFSPLSKIVLTFAMLLGRLEIYPMLILFYPSCWKRSRS